MPEMNRHLLECVRCRHVMVDTALDEAERLPDSKICHTRRSLLAEWRDAVELYATTLSELMAAAGKVPDSELVTLAKISETGRKLTAKIRAELDEHIDEHCC